MALRMIGPCLRCGPVLQLARRIHTLATEWDRCSERRRECYGYLRNRGFYPDRLEYFAKIWGPATLEEG